MYDEAISFFEYVLRKDRPVSELLSADYDFLNAPLAKYYGVTKEIKSKNVELGLLKAMPKDEIFVILK